MEKEKKQKLFRMGDTSRITGVTQKSLEQWIYRDIISSSYKTQFNYNVFTKKDILKIYIIRILKEAGVSLIKGKEFSDIIVESKDPFQRIPLSEGIYIQIDRLKISLELQTKLEKHDYD